MPTHKSQYLNNLAENYRMIKCKNLLSYGTRSMIGKSSTDSGGRQCIVHFESVENIKEYFGC